MDINTMTEVVRQPANQPGVHWRDGNAWLAGGTWLFSDKQPQLCRLIDPMPLGWTGLTVSDDGLGIGAMCTIRDLYEFTAPAYCRAAPLIATSGEAFSGLLQGVERRDGRWQHLHVTARWPDDHTDGRAPGQLRAVVGGRIGTDPRGSRFRAR